MEDGGLKEAAGDDTAEPPEEPKRFSPPNWPDGVPVELYSSSPPPPIPEPDSEDDLEILTEPLFGALYEGPAFTAPAFSHMNPKIQCRKSKEGTGLFAIRNVKKDELLVGWAGKVVHLTDILRMDESERTYILQIDEELFQVPFWKGYNEPADFVNHSCEPNAGFGNSPISLVAMRNIKRGEEILFDYALCESIDGLKGNEFECTCGAVCCRGKFTGGDWKNPVLWDKYGKYFSPYLRANIKKLKQEIRRQELCRQHHEPLSL